MKKMIALILALLLIGICAWAEEEPQTTTLRLGRFSIDIPQHWYYSIYTHSDNLDSLELFFYPEPDWMDPSTGYINLRYFRTDDADEAISKFLENQSSKEDYSVDETYVDGIQAKYCIYRYDALDVRISAYCFLVSYDDVAVELLYQRTSDYDTENAEFISSIIETVHIKPVDDDTIEDGAQGEEQDDDLASLYNEHVARYCTYKLDGPYLYHAADGDYIALFYDWINTDDSPRDDFLLVSVEAYQNGHDLDSAWLDDFWDKYHDPNDKYMPGYGGRSYKIFKLEDDSDVSFVVDTDMDIVDAYEDVVFTVNPSELSTID